MPAILRRERLLQALSHHDVLLEYGGLRPLAMPEHFGADPIDSICSVTDGTRYGLSLLHFHEQDIYSELRHALASEGPVPLATLFAADVLAQGAAKSVHWGDAVNLWNTYAADGHLFWYDTDEETVAAAFNRLLAPFPGWTAA